MDFTEREEYSFNAFQEQLDGIIQSYSKGMDQIILGKLERIKMRALQIRELELFEILNKLDYDHLNARNIVKVYKELQKEGYELEIKYPQPDLQFTGHSLKAVIDPNRIIIKVKKLLITD